MASARGLIQIRRMRGSRGWCHTVGYASRIEELTATATQTAEELRYSVEDGALFQMQNELKRVREERDKLLARAKSKVQDLARVRALMESAKREKEEASKRADTASLTLRETQKKLETTESLLNKLEGEIEAERMEGLEKAEAISSHRSLLSRMQVEVRKGRDRAEEAENELNKALTKHRQIETERENERNRTHEFQRKYKESERQVAGLKEQKEELTRTVRAQKEAIEGLEGEVASLQQAVNAGDGMRESLNDVIGGMRAKLQKTRKDLSGPCPITHNVTQRPTVDVYPEPQGRVNWFETFVGGVGGGSSISGAIGGKAAGAAGMIAEGEAGGAVASAATASLPGAGGAVLLAALIVTAAFFCYKMTRGNAQPAPSDLESESNHLTEEERSEAPGASNGDDDASDKGDDASDKGDDASDKGDDASDKGGDAPAAAVRSKRKNPPHGGLDERRRQIGKLDHKRRERGKVGSSSKGIAGQKSQSKGKVGSSSKGIAGQKNQS
eukprot:Cvel_17782.t1-p1 / transcript=Cvel_17782.t1 / gene=Cvel_17782 / organism=Chromera_velia_CCMP2878 / gene_product=hypothetical protein / transcript_product=hypothetical protein / location=Cvel_scaffold1438:1175-9659(-) / protein_length=500 / sequence_SO=supercontig / SO=protein_coding / is_pseudo=false